MSNANLLTMLLAVYSALLSSANYFTARRSKRRKLYVRCSLTSGLTDRGYKNQVRVHIANSSEHPITVTEILVAHINTIFPKRIYHHRRIFAWWVEFIYNFGSRWVTVRQSFRQSYLRDRDYKFPFEIPVGSFVEINFIQEEIIENLDSNISCVFFTVSDALDNYYIGPPLKYRSKKKEIDFF